MTCHSRLPELPDLPESSNLRVEWGENEKCQVLGPGGAQTCTLDKNGVPDRGPQPKTIPDAPSGSVITPGLFDVQVNGFGGVDFNSASLGASDMDLALAHLAASGAGMVLPTLITAFEDDLIARLGALDRAVSKSALGPFMVPGYHLEGPFLSPKEGCAGCHPAAAMGPGDLELVERLMAISTRPILMMTLAPEQLQVPELIPQLVSRNITCAIGHTQAKRAQIEVAVAAGARVSTHLGNGLPHTIDKRDNALFSQLANDDLTAGFIADGIHVHPDNLKIFLRSKGPDRAFLVTDAVAAAGHGLAAGTYRLGGDEIERHEDGTVRLPGSAYLAGSSTTMDQMVRNVMNWFDLDLKGVLKLTLCTPHRVVFRQPYQLVAGKPASLVYWEKDAAGALQVNKTRIGPFVIRGHRN